MPVPSVAILKFLRSTRKSSGWTSSNVFMMMLYVSDTVDDGFLCILTLMLWILRSSPNYKLTSGIGGGSIRACMSSLIHVTFLMV